MRKLTLSIDTSIHEVILGDSPCGVSQDPAEIIPNVFIGSVEVAKDADRLSKHGIEAVVNASKVVYNLPSSISLLRVEVEDSPDVNLACHFQKTSQFICEHVQRGQPVLVHCKAGISRSAAIVIAYLIHSGEKSSLREAYLHTRSRKPNVHPNLGFFRQLQEWEREVTGASSMPLEEYYEVVFASFGFSKVDIQSAVKQVGTENYHAIVDYLHARSTTPSTLGNTVCDFAPPPSPAPSSMQTTPLTTPISSAAASNASSKCMYTVANN